MQWDKVKNVLIAILLAVNAFLLGNLGFQYYQNSSREAELYRHVSNLLAEDGATLCESFRLPGDKTLPVLSLDRSRIDEEKTAAAMLGDEMERTEDTDGTVLFESGQGTLSWNGDGTVNGRVTDEEGEPADERDAERRLRAAIQRWSLIGEHDTMRFAGGKAMLSGTLAGMPVHNRGLTLQYDGGQIVIEGFWSFGTPYTTAQGTGTTCAAADALLAFAAENKAVGEIQEMTAGYRLQMDSSRRLQLTPTWKIRTETQEYLVDCAKKTVI